MKKMLAVALIGIVLNGCATSQAQTKPPLTARIDTSTFLIYEERCTIKAALDQVPATLHPRLGKAKATVEGKAYNACWFLVPGGIRLLYEDGDVGMIPYEAFNSSTTPPPPPRNSTEHSLPVEGQSRPLDI